MANRFALATLVLSFLAVGAAYGSAFLPGGAPAWSGWAMALGIAGAMTGMLILGAARRGRVGVLKWPFAFVFLIVAGGFGAVLALPAAEGVGAPLYFGLPLRAAVVLYGVGLLPLLAMPLVYALTFDRMTLGADEFERICRDARAAVAPPASAVAAAVQPEPSEVA